MNAFKVGSISLVVAMVGALLLPEVAVPEADGGTCGLEISGLARKMAERRALKEQEAFVKAHPGVAPPPIGISGMNTAEDFTAAQKRFDRGMEAFGLKPIKSDPNILVAEEIRNEMARMRGAIKSDSIAAREAEVATGTSAKDAALARKAQEVAAAAEAKTSKAEEAAKVKAAKVAEDAEKAAKAEADKAAKQASEVAAREKALEHSREAFATSGKSSDSRPVVVITHAVDPNNEKQVAALTKAVGDLKLDNPHILFAPENGVEKLSAESQKALSEALSQSKVGEASFASGPLQEKLGALSQKEILEKVASTNAVKGKSAEVFGFVPEKALADRRNLASGSNLRQVMVASGKKDDELSRALAATRKVKSEHIVDGDHFFAADAGKVKGQVASRAADDSEKSLTGAATRAVEGQGTDLKSVAARAKEKEEAARAKRNSDVATLSHRPSYWPPNQGEPKKVQIRVGGKLVDAVLDTFKYENPSKFEGEVNALYRVEKAFRTEEGALYVISPRDQASQLKALMEKNGFPFVPQITEYRSNPGLYEYLGFTVKHDPRVGEYWATVPDAKFMQSRIERWNKEVASTRQGGVQTSVAHTGADMQIEMSRLKAYFGESGMGDPFKGFSEKYAPTGGGAPTHASMQKLVIDPLTGELKKTNSLYWHDIHQMVQMVYVSKPVQEEMIHQSAFEVRMHDILTGAKGLAEKNGEDFNAVRIGADGNSKSANAIREAFTGFEKTGGGAAIDLSKPGVSVDRYFTEHVHHGQRSIHSREHLGAELVSGIHPDGINANRVGARLTDLFDSEVYIHLAGGSGAVKEGENRTWAPLLRRNIELASADAKPVTLETTLAFGNEIRSRYATMIEEMESAFKDAKGMPKTQAYLREEMTKLKAEFADIVDPLKNQKSPAEIKALAEDMKKSFWSKTQMHAGMQEEFFASDLLKIAENNGKTLTPSASKSFMEYVKSFVSKPRETGARNFGIFSFSEMRQIKAPVLDLQAQFALREMVPGIFERFSQTGAVPLRRQDQILHYKNAPLSISDSTPYQLAMLTRRDAALLNSTGPSRDLARLVVDDFGKVARMTDGAAIHGFESTERGHQLETAVANAISAVESKGAELKASSQAGMRDGSASFEVFNNSREKQRTFIEAFQKSLVDQDAAAGATKVAKATDMQDLAQSLYHICNKGGNCGIGDEKLVAHFNEKIPLSPGMAARIKAQEAEGFRAVASSGGARDVTSRAAELHTKSLTDAILESSHEPAGKMTPLSSQLAFDKKVSDGAGGSFLHTKPWDWNYARKVEELSTGHYIKQITEITPETAAFYQMHGLVVGYHPDVGHYLAWAPDAKAATNSVDHWNKTVMDAHKAGWVDDATARKLVARVRADEQGATTQWTMEKNRVAVQRRIDEIRAKNPQLDEELYDRSKISFGRTDGFHSDANIFTASPAYEAGVEKQMARGPVGQAKENRGLYWHDVQQWMNVLFMDEGLETASSKRALAITEMLGEIRQVSSLEEKGAGHPSPLWVKNKHTSDMAHDMFAEANKEHPGPQTAKAYRGMNKEQGGVELGRLWGVEVAFFDASAEHGGTHYLRQFIDHPEGISLKELVSVRESVKAGRGIPEGTSAAVRDLAMYGEQILGEESLWQLARAGGKITEDAKPPGAASGVMRYTFQDAKVRDTVTLESMLDHWFNGGVAKMDKVIGMVEDPQVKARLVAKMKSLEDEGVLVRYSEADIKKMAQDLRESAEAKKQFAKRMIPDPIGVKPVSDLRPDDLKLVQGPWGVNPEKPSFLGAYREMKANIPTILDQMQAEVKGLEHLLGAADTAEHIGDLKQVKSILKEAAEASHGDAQSYYASVSKVRAGIATAVGQEKEMAYRAKFLAEDIERYFRAPNGIPLFVSGDKHVMAALEDAVRAAEKSVPDARAFAYMEKDLKAAELSPAWDKKRTAFVKAFQESIEKQGIENPATKKALSGMAHQFAETCLAGALCGGVEKNSPWGRIAAAMDKKAGQGGREVASRAADSHGTSLTQAALESGAPAKSTAARSISPATKSERALLAKEEYAQARVTNQIRYLETQRNDLKSALAKDAEEKAAGTSKSTYYADRAASTQAEIKRSEPILKQLETDLEKAKSARMAGTSPQRAEEVAALVRLEKAEVAESVFKHDVAVLGPKAQSNELVPGDVAQRTYKQLFERREKAYQASQQELKAASADVERLKGRNPHGLESDSKAATVAADSSGKSLTQAALGDAHPHLTPAQQTRVKQLEAEIARLESEGKKDNGLNAKAKGTGLREIAAKRELRALRGESDQLLPGEFLKQLSDPPVAKAGTVLPNAGRTLKDFAKSPDFKVQELLPGSRMKVRGNDNLEIWGVSFPRGEEGGPLWHVRPKDANASYRKAMERSLGLDRDFNTEASKAEVAPLMQYLHYSVGERSELGEFAATIPSPQLSSHLIHEFNAAVPEADRIAVDFMQGGGVGQWPMLQHLQDNHKIDIASYMRDYSYAPLAAGKGKEQQFGDLKAVYGLVHDANEPSGERKVFMGYADHPTLAEHDDRQVQQTLAIPQQFFKENSDRDGFFTQLREIYKKEEAKNYDELVTTLKSSGMKEEDAIKQANAERAAGRLAPGSSEGEWKKLSDSFRPTAARLHAEDETSLSGHAADLMYPGGIKAEGILKMYAYPQAGQFHALSHLGNNIIEAERDGYKLTWKTVREYPGISAKGTNFADEAMYHFARLGAAGSKADDFKMIRKMLNIEEKDVSDLVKWSWYKGSEVRKPGLAADAPVTLEYVYDYILNGGIRRIEKMVEDIDKSTGSNYARTLLDKYKAEGLLQPVSPADIKKIADAHKERYISQAQAAKTHFGVDGEVRAPIFSKMAPSDIVSPLDPNRNGVASVQAVRSLNNYKLADTIDLVDQIRKSKLPEDVKQAHLSNLEKMMGSKDSPSLVLKDKSTHSFWAFQKKSEDLDLEIAKATRADNVAALNGEKGLYQERKALDVERNKFAREHYGDYFSARAALTTEHPANEIAQRAKNLATDISRTLTTRDGRPLVIARDAKAMKALEDAVGAAEKFRYPAFNTREQLLAKLKGDPNYFEKIGLGKDFVKTALKGQDVERDATGAVKNMTPRQFYEISQAVWKKKTDAFEEAFKAGVGPEHQQFARDFAKICLAGANCGVAELKVAVAKGYRDVEALFFNPVAVDKEGERFLHILSGEVETVTASNPSRVGKDISPGSVAKVSAADESHLMGDVATQQRWNTGSAKLDAMYTQRDALMAKAATRESAETYKLEAAIKDLEHELAEVGKPRIDAEIAKLKTDLTQNPIHFSEELNKKLDRALDDAAHGKPYSPADFLKAVADSGDERLKKWLSIRSSSGTEAGSVHHHLVQVANNFEIIRNQFALNKVVLPGNVPAERFMRDFLLVHDLAKSEAVALGAKDAQHAFIGPAMDGYLKARGYNRDLRLIAASMVENDTFGHTLWKAAATQSFVERKALSTAFVKDMRAAHEALATEFGEGQKFSIQDYSKMMSAYFHSDASAYKYPDHIFAGVGMPAAVGHVIVDRDPIVARGLEALGVHDLPETKLAGEVTSRAASDAKSSLSEVASRPVDGSNSLTHQLGRELRPANQLEVVGKALLTSSGERDVFKMAKPSEPLAVLRVRDFPEGSKLDEMASWVAPGGKLILENDSGSVGFVQLSSSHFPLVKKLMGEGWDAKASLDRKGFFDTVQLTRPAGGSVKVPSAEVEKRWEKIVTRDGRYPNLAHDGNAKAGSAGVVSRAAQDAAPSLSEVVNPKVPGQKYLSLLPDRDLNAIRGPKNWQEAYEKLYPNMGVILDKVKGEVSEAVKAGELSAKEGEKRIAALEGLAKRIGADKSPVAQREFYKAVYEARASLAEVDKAGEIENRTRKLAQDLDRLFVSPDGLNLKASEDAVVWVALKEGIIEANQVKGISTKPGDLAWESQKTAFVKGFLRNLPEAKREAFADLSNRFAETCLAGALCGGTKVPGFWERLAHDAGAKVGSGDVVSRAARDSSPSLSSQLSKQGIGSGDFRAQLDAVIKAKFDLGVEARIQGKAFIPRRPEMQARLTEMSEVWAGVPKQKGVSGSEAVKGVRPDAAFRDTIAEIAKTGKLPDSFLDDTKDLRANLKTMRFLCDLTCTNESNPKRLDELVKVFGHVERASRAEEGMAGKVKVAAAELYKLLDETNLNKIGEGLKGMEALHGHEIEERIAKRIATAREIMARGDGSVDKFGNVKTVSIEDYHLVRKIDGELAALALSNTIATDGLKGVKNVDQARAKSATSFQAIRKIYDEVGLVHDALEKAADNGAKGLKVSFDTEHAAQLEKAFTYFEPGKKGAARDIASRAAGDGSTSLTRELVRVATNSDDFRLSQYAVGRGYAEKAMVKYWGLKAEDALKADRAFEGPKGLKAMMEDVASKPIPAVRGPDLHDPSKMVTYITDAHHRAWQIDHILYSKAEELPEAIRRALSPANPKDWSTIEANRQILRDSANLRPNLEIEAEYKNVGELVTGLAQRKKGLPDDAIANRADFSAAQLRARQLAPGEVVSKRDEQILADGYSKGMKKNFAELNAPGKGGDDPVRSAIGTLFDSVYLKDVGKVNAGMVDYAEFLAARDPALMAKVRALGISNANFDSHEIQEGLKRIYFDDQRGRNALRDLGKATEFDKNGAIVDNAWRVRTNELHAKGEYAVVPPIFVHNSLVGKPAPIYTAGMLRELEARNPAAAAVVRAQDAGIRELANARHAYFNGGSFADLEKANQTWGHLEANVSGVSERSRRLGYLRQEADFQEREAARLKAEWKTSGTKADLDKYVAAKNNQIALEAQLAGETKSAARARRGSGLKDELDSVADSGFTKYQKYFPGRSAEDLKTPTKSESQLLAKLMTRDDAEASRLADESRQSVVQALSSTVAQANPRLKTPEEHLARARELFQGLSDAHAESKATNRVEKEREIYQSLAKKGWTKEEIDSCQKAGLCVANLPTGLARRSESELSPLALKVVAEEEMALAEGKRAEDAKGFYREPRVSRDAGTEVKDVTRTLEAQKKALETEVAKFAEGGSKLEKERATAQRALDAVERKLDTLNSEGTQKLLANAKPLAEKLEKDGDLSVLNFLRTTERQALAKIHPSLAEFSMKGLEGVEAKTDTGAARLFRYREFKKALNKLDPVTERPQAYAAIRESLAKSGDAKNPLGAQLKAASAPKDLSGAFTKSDQLADALGSRVAKVEHAVFTDAKMSEADSALVRALTSTEPSALERRAEGTLASKKADAEIGKIRESQADADRKIAAQEGRKLASVESPSIAHNAEEKLKGLGGMDGKELKALARSFEDVDTVNKQLVAEAKAIKDVAAREKALAALAENGSDAKRALEHLYEKRSNPDMFDAYRMAYGHAAEEFKKTKNWESSWEEGVRKMMVESGYSKDEAKAKYLSTARCLKI